MDKFMKDLNNELEKKINEYFLSKGSIKVHNNPVYIDTNHAKKPTIDIEPIEISLDDIIGKTSFQKAVKGKIEFMEKIDGGSSLAQIEITFKNTTIRYEQKEKSFSIELGAEFCGRPT